MAGSERARLATRIRGWRLIVALAGVSFVTALIATRFGGLDGPWLWNLDTPVDFPRTVFLHDALAQGRLPFWIDQLGLGYPFYAEGQAGGFYPPHWLIFQLPPLVALDVTRVVHLVLLGVGTGLVALRLSGSRGGAILAAGAITLVGGLVPKLEWTNLIEGFAWLPWVLLPLFRRPAPTRLGIVGSGVALGMQALLGHPNVLAYTALSAGVVLVVISPSIRSVGRLVVVGLIGFGVGAVQLVPMAILLTLSARAGGIDRADLFAYPATPFDPLFFAFANVFVPANGAGWDIGQTWYPNIHWGLLEGGGYVGLPMLALTAIGLSTRRARPLLVVIPVLALIPILASFKPDIWASLPILDSLRRPTRVYLFIDFALVVGAAVGVGRLGRGLVPWRRAVAVVALPVAGYVVLLGLVNVVPSVFSQLLDGRWSVPAGAGERYLVAARAALNQVYPFVPEIAVGAVALWLIRRRLRGPAVVSGLVALCLVPMAILMPSVNQALARGAFDYGDSTYLQTLVGLAPHRELAFAQNVFFPGLPNQPQMAGVADIRMHSSLSLSATDALLDDLVAHGDDLTLAKAVGIDTVVTYGRACNGVVVAQVPKVHVGQDAYICHLPDALKPPYWVPANAVRLEGGGGALPISPRDASLDPSVALTTARSAAIASWDASSDAFIVNAPAPGWVFVDRAWWPTWRTTVDGVETPAYRALGGQIVFVLPGTHLIQQVLVPWDAALGLGIGLATLILAGAWADVLGGVRRQWSRWRPCRRRRRPWRRRRRAPGFSANVPLEDE